MLDRDVFMLPPKETGCVNKVWKLKKCLYSLNDAARQFYVSLAAELVKLGCKQSELDPTMYHKKDVNGQLIGMIVTYVDDFLHCGNGQFDQEVMVPLRKRFISGRVEQSNFKYVGLQIRQRREGIVVDQGMFFENLETVPVEPGVKSEELSGAAYSRFRAAVGSLNWGVSGSRPDLAYDVIEHSTKFNKATKADMDKVNKSIMKGKIMLENRFSVLGPTVKWKLVGFSDAAWANLPDEVSSTMGYVIFLVGDEEKCAPLCWKSNKIKRVVRSTLAAETLALVEMIEMMVYVRSLLKETGLFTTNPLIAVVDNQSLRDAIYSTKLVDDKRLRVDMACIKESMNKREVEAVKWCSGEVQLANCLTKRGACTESLRAVLQSGTLPLSKYL